MMFCVARYECEESFTTLNVDIRNHQNLLDSMEQYVKGDLLEGANAYHCEKCNKKVRTELHVVVVVKPFLLVCMVKSIYFLEENAPHNFQQPPQYFILAPGLVLGLKKNPI